MDYDLTRLGSHEFEHVVQALVMRAFGADTIVFGDGPDGGREATYEGELRWADSRVWEGYTVIQAKFRRRLGPTVDDNATWLTDQIRAELARWVNPKGRRFKQGRRPQFFLVVSNVPLSATEGGGIETVTATLKKEAADIGVTDCHLWHYDSVCRLLDDASDIRVAYSGLITPGDVLAELRDALTGTAATLGETLTAHAAKDLLADRSVRLGQAGSASNERLSLADIGVDLPALLRPAEPGKKPTVVRTIEHIIGHANAVRRSSVVGETLPTKPHLVLVGGPGQGKTTLGQLLCQAYRVALLGDMSLQGDADVALRDLRQRVSAIALPTPASRRWPIRIDLAAYGDAIAGGADISMLRWIAQQVSDRGGVDLSGPDLREWLKQWPWIVVLDGLDEVVALPARERVMQAVSEFMIDAWTVDADLVIVATTRPQGYAGEFSDTSYTHLQLLPLDPAQATDYGEHLVSVRLADDEVLRDQIIDRINSAARSSTTMRLMRTPLQVTIMSLLLEGQPNLPQHRYGLFSAYYDVIYAREASKPGHLARLVAEHRLDIEAIHETAGLRLQTLAELEAESEAILPAAVLTEVITDRLVQEGHQGEMLQRLVDDLRRATTDRLVLLVPKGESGVGFEVRTLQEFMAGRALGVGTDDDVLHRLTVTAHAAHWRNTWLLAVGHLFATREHIRPRVLARLREMDADEGLNAVIPPGPELALDLLDDDVAGRSPAVQRQLLMHALDLLGIPLVEPSRVADVLHEVGQDTSLRHLISPALDQAVAGTPGSHYYALDVCVELKAHADELGAHARRLDAAAPYPSAPQTKVSVGETIDAFLQEPGLVGASKIALEDFLFEMRGVRLDPANGPVYTPIPGAGALAVVEHSDAAQAVAIAILELTPEQWAVSAALRGVLSFAAKRRPCGPRLLQPGVT